MQPAADLAHGRKIADVAGCISCHGPALDGHLFEEDPAFALAWSSNLSRLLPKLTDNAIEQILRTGRRPDGTALWFMPTFAHRQMSTEEMRDLIAFLRTAPVTGKDHPRMTRGPQFAAAIAAGMSDSAAQAERLAPRAPPDLGPALENGRHLARLACSECHGPELKGPQHTGPGAPPDLAAVAAYTPAQFTRLIHEGLGRDGKPAGGMGEAFARERLFSLTPAEISSIYGYLRARAG